MPRSARALAVSLLCVSTASGGPSFVNWESPHVSPLGERQHTRVMIDSTNISPNHSLTHSAPPPEKVLSCVATLHYSAFNEKLANPKGEICLMFLVLR